MTSEGDLLVVEGVELRYGRVVALTGVSLTVPCGGVVAVLGPNGAGKSSLLAALAGLRRLHRGRVVFDGEEVTSLPSHRRARSGMVLVPEGRRIFSNLTVEENLRLGAFNLASSELNAASAAVYELFPVLADKRSALGGAMSGGEQQMLALARGLISRPRLLLLDEPSLGLAPKVVAALYEQIGLLRARGIAVLLVEQQVRRALAIADHVVVLHERSVSVSGTPAELAADSRLLAAYTGQAAGAG